jgi:hypothetical protein
MCVYINICMLYFMYECIHGMYVCVCMNILWHVDLLQGNDREINNYTTAVAGQRLRK